MITSPCSCALYLALYQGVMKCTETDPCHLFALLGGPGRGRRASAIGFRGSDTVKLASGLFPVSLTLFE